MNVPTICLNTLPVRTVFPSFFLLSFGFVGIILSFFFIQLYIIIIIWIFMCLFVDIYIHVVKSMFCIMHVHMKYIDIYTHFLCGEFLKALRAEILKKKLDKYTFMLYIKKVYITYKSFSCKYLGSQFFINIIHYTIVHLITGRWTNSKLNWLGLLP